MFKTAQRKQDKKNSRQDTLFDSKRESVNSVDACIMCSTQLPN